MLLKPNYDFLRQLNMPINSSVSLKKYEMSFVSKIILLVLLLLFVITAYVLYIQPETIWL